MGVNASHASEPMGIGAVAARTGESARSLRYWEQRGLLSPSRDSRGHRTYDDEALVVVAQVRTLLDVGLTTEEIGLLLPCARGQGPTFELCDDVVGFLRAHADRLDRDLADTRRRRDAVEHLLAGDA